MNQNNNGNGKHTDLITRETMKRQTDKTLLFSRCMAAIYINIMSEYCISDINIFQKFLQIMLAKHKERKETTVRQIMKQENDL